MDISENILTCHLCSSKDITLYPESACFNRVTSDCKPWSSGENLACCNACNTVQALITDRWRVDAEQIYKKYEIYHQGAGLEQAVFDLNGFGQTRSSRLISKLSAEVKIKENGRILDVGCANGNFLRAFSVVFPNWQLYGAEFDAKHSSDLKCINNFSTLYTEPLGLINEKFDIISLIHTLEHIESPLNFLQEINRLLAPGGIVFVQVPYFMENPFGLMTADHATHFDSKSLVKILNLAGFQVPKLSSKWVSKELSAVATQRSNLGVSVDLEEELSVIDVKQSLEWIRLFLDKAKAVQACSDGFGIFGSSIAATWLASNLPKPPDFFVDEDPARVGGTHMNQKIFLPSEAPRPASIFIALQKNASDHIFSRFGNGIHRTWIQ
jgi:SAM-dependent methyltransferase